MCNVRCVCLCDQIHLTDDFGAAPLRFTATTGHPLASLVPRGTGFPDGAGRPISSLFIALRFAPAVAALLRGRRRFAAACLGVRSGRPHPTPVFAALAGRRRQPRSAAAGRCPPLRHRVPGGTLAPLSPVAAAPCASVRMPCGSPQGTGAERPCYRPPEAACFIAPGGAHHGIRLRLTKNLPASGYHRACFASTLNRGDLLMQNAPACIT